MHGVSIIVYTSPFTWYFFVVLFLSVTYSCFITLFSVSFRSANISVLTLSEKVSLQF